MIGRTKFNIVKIGKWRSKKKLRKTNFKDLPDGTLVGLNCANTKAGLCKNRNGRLHVPNNWDSEIPYVVKPENCFCDTLGITGEMTLQKAKEKNTFRAMISQKSASQHSSKGVVRRE